MCETELRLTNSERKEKFKAEPYVVSEDIGLLLQDWADKKGFILPNNEFFVNLRNQFRLFMEQIFPNFDLVSENKLSEGLRSMVNQSGLFPVSLDEVYFPAETGLRITRLVDNKGQSKGLGRRAYTPSLLSQFRSLKADGIDEIVLIDDVIFTGDLMERVIRLLNRLNIRVPLICAGIGVAEGINLLNSNQREVQCVVKYNNVVDEICERDFYPGVPLSGRLLTIGKNVGVPYLLPFGKPTEWASIPPEWAESFSRFCLQQTIALFEEVEINSKRIISCRDLGRSVILLPQDETRFIDAINIFL